MMLLLIFSPRVAAQENSECFMNDIAGSSGPSIFSMDCGMLSSDFLNYYRQKHNYFPSSGIPDKVIGINMVVLQSPGADPQNFTSSDIYVFQNIIDEINLIYSALDAPDKDLTCVYIS